MILVTGGAGYIGSHTCVALDKAGYDFLIVDNFSNSDPNVIRSISRITGKTINYTSCDVRDSSYLNDLFKKYSFQAVVHCAGSKAVGESVEYPLYYYENNIVSTLTLCQTMCKFNVKKLVFSSSATVYRSDNKMPVDEEGSLGCLNPYGWTKFVNEQFLRDLHQSDREWSIALLRYFNPIGAHESGMLGERPVGAPNNLMPYITQVASGKREILHVFGNDYDTIDGTGMRDYIHVMDLANGHISALDYINNNKGIEAFNLGVGRAYSVLEVVKTFENATGEKIPYVFDKRRSGDIPICYARTDKAQKVLNWHAERNLIQMCEDAWRFERNQMDL